MEKTWVDPSITENLQLDLREANDALKENISSMKRQQSEYEKQKSFLNLIILSHIKLIGKYGFSKDIYYYY